MSNPACQKLEINSAGLILIGSDGCYKKHNRKHYHGDYYYFLTLTALSKVFSRVSCSWTFCQKRLIIAAHNCLAYYACRLDMLEFKGFTPQVLNQLFPWLVFDTKFNSFAMTQNWQNTIKREYPHHLNNCMWNNILQLSFLESGLSANMSNAIAVASRREWVKHSQQLASGDWPVFVYISAVRLLMGVNYFFFYSGNWKQWPTH